MIIKLCLIVYVKYSAVSLVLTEATQKTSDYYIQIISGEKFTRPELEPGHLYALTSEQLGSSRAGTFCPDAVFDPIYVLLMTSFGVTLFIADADKIITKK